MEANKKSGKQVKQSSRKEKQRCDLGWGERRATTSPYQAQRCFSIFWFIGQGRPTTTSHVLARFWLRTRRLDAPPQAALEVVASHPRVNASRGNSKHHVLLVGLFRCCLVLVFLPSVHKAKVEGMIPFGNIEFDV